MKAMSKTELARAAGVSLETFRRWLKSDRAFLEANGIRPTTKLFPPNVVKYLSVLATRHSSTHKRSTSRSAATSSHKCITNSKLTPQKSFIMAGKVSHEAHASDGVWHGFCR